MTVIDPETQAGWVPEADEEDDEEEMPLSLRLSIADTLTLGNATCGFMAVYFTTTGILIPHLTGSDETRHGAAQRGHRGDPDAAARRSSTSSTGWWRASCAPRRWARSWTTSPT